jgi:Ca2+/H+ antiporter
VCVYALSQVAESVPLTLKRFGFTTSFSSVSFLSWAPGMPDLVLAILFALQNDISAAIDVGLAAALTVSMYVAAMMMFVH